MRMISESELPDVIWGSIKKTGNFSTLITGLRDICDRVYGGVHQLKVEGSVLYVVPDGHGIDWQIMSVVPDHPRGTTALQLKFISDGVSDGILATSIERFLQEKNIPYNTTDPRLVQRTYGLWLDQEDAKRNWRTG